jgi:hypothetical protein
MSVLVLIVSKTGSGPLLYTAYCRLLQCMLCASAYKDVLLFPVQYL